MSNVREITENRDSGAIVSMIISMAQHLNLEVIAEGVETEEQLKFLHHSECYNIQGFYFSPPVPEHECKKLIRKQNKQIV